MIRALALLVATLTACNGLTTGPGGTGTGSGTGTGVGTGSTPQGMGPGTSTGTEGQACTDLRVCCGTIDSAATAVECESVAEMSDGASCAASLADFQAAGLCGVTVSPPGSGPGTSTSSGSGVSIAGCSGLLTCCASLQGSAQAACEEVVSAGNVPTCSAEIMVYEEAGECSGASSGSGSGSSGCAELSSCCLSLDGTDEVACEEIVSAGSDAECSAELSVYESAGMCFIRSSGSGSGSGSSSTSTAAGCSGLASCCTTLDSAEQAACNAVVSDGSDEICSEELTSYMDAGLCQ